MHSGILFPICRGRTQAVQQAVDGWLSERTLELFTADVEDMLDACIALGKEVCYLRQTVWRRAFAGQIRCVQETGERLLESFAAVLHVFDTARDTIRMAKAWETHKEKRTEFERVEGEVRKLKEDLLNRWPRVDFEMLKRSDAEYARGESQSLKEAFDELLDRGNQVGQGQDGGLEPAPGAQVGSGTASA
jgi:hypothetical protein